MKHILRCATILAALALGFSLNSCENNVTVNATSGETAAATKTLTLTGRYMDRSVGGLVTKSLEIEYTDNDTWKDIAERYDEVSLKVSEGGPSEGKIVVFWDDPSQDIDGCHLKSNESTYFVNLVSCNDKVSAYSSSSFYLEQ